MIKYEIWQMPLSNPNKFYHYDWCEKPIEIKDYVMVYAGRTALRDDVDDTLEDIFELLNNNHPHDYYAASLSVSDVVCLIIGNQRGWFYVDGFGFKKLDW